MPVTFGPGCAHIVASWAKSWSLSERLAAATFSSRCAQEEVPGIGSMTGERRSSQARGTGGRGEQGGGDLGVGGPEPVGDRGGRVGDVGPCCGGDRKPRNEGDPAPLAVLEYVLGGAIGEVVAVLDAHDRCDLLGLGELVDGDFREADVPDFSLVLKMS